MLVIPAIDIRRGRCVRLYQGKESEETIYWKDPVEMATIWESRGAKMLHVADLDGAFQGKPANLDKVERMKALVKIPIQLGGGIRDMAAIEAAIAAGADRVILGTVAVYNPALVKQAVERFGPAIAVSIDVAEDFVTVAGWKEISSIRFVDLAQRMKDLGVMRFLFTDTRKDGTLTGPNIAGIREFLAAATPVPVTVSGGISSVDDLVTLREYENQGLSAVVVGKALYDRKFTLQEALRVTS
ncbi:MAG: 1-(5-phosphoribosyl)-5-[(5-phosphoribosylamino)methylideneamino]imidazole-4-carboxamide isomerase [Elusimicrobiota bacterium]|jgi:phosphoribosylformimino-5-aminoimidazole carboxamide ribotide isomerase